MTFKTITFDKAGTYSYEIREVLPKDDDSKTDGIQSSNVTYDENIYHVTVDVKDNTEKGCLEAAVTYEDSDGAPVFVNTYTEPEIPAAVAPEGSGPAQTGDTASFGAAVFALLASFAAMAASFTTIVRRRRR